MSDFISLLWIFIGRMDDTFIIDGYLPEDSVPDSTSNIFISAEGKCFKTQTDNFRFAVSYHVIVLI